MFDDPTNRDLLINFMASPDKRGEAVRALLETGLPAEQLALELVLQDEDPSTSCELA
jgi:hypothetical protein